MASLNSPELTEAFDLLTHPHRRYVLYYLSNESNVVNIDTLAVAIAKWDGEHTGTAQTNHEEILWTLHHTHLPKLADAGVITFGPNRDSITLREMGHLDQFLDDTAAIDGYTKITADD